MNKNNITDNKKFWKTVKPYLSNKVRTTDKIKLVENGEIITNDQEVADILNEFLATIVKKLKLPNPPETLDTNTNDPVLQCINKYSDHPSIKIINEKIKDINAFNFSKVEDKDVEKLIQGLDIKKATQEEDVHTNILKENTDIFSPYLCRAINDSISKSSFPDFLKRANITPVHKKSTKTEKDNYRPVSILSNLSIRSDNTFLRSVYNGEGSYGKSAEKSIPENCLMQGMKQALVSYDLFLFLYTYFYTLLYM